MKYALIGCGRISANHIKAAANNGFEIVAVCDTDPSQMEKLVKDQKILHDSQTHKYTDYQEMILKENPDLVSIATESGKHARIALDCIEAGVHTIIEKPMAMSISDADKIIAAEKNSTVKVSVCLQNRFNIAIRELRKAIDAGRFGKLSHGTIHIRWNRNKDYYQQGSWRGTWGDDGGALMNQCIHGIDLLQWMLGGEVEEVYGVIKRQLHSYIETEDLGMAILKFSNGALATIEGTTNVFPKNLEETLYIFGEKGTVKIGGTAANNIDLWRFNDESDYDVKNKIIKEVTSNVYGNGHTSLFADFADAIANDRKPYIDAKAGKKSLEIVLAIYKSMQEGLPVKLPLNDFSSIEMKGMFN